MAHWCGRTGDWPGFAAVFLTLNCRVHSPQETAQLSDWADGSDFYAASIGLNSCRDQGWNILFH